MDITVERNHVEDELVFTIRVRGFNKIEKSLMLREIEYYKSEMTSLPPMLGESINLFMASLRNKEIERLIRKTKFHIDNQLRNRINHISQEIYNLIYDYQEMDIKQIINEFEPNRTRYYFDNDRESCKPEPQESEHDDDDLSDWDDEDSDEN